MFNVRRITWVACIALAVAASGCSTKYEVQSDTSWSGFVEDHSVVGRGSMTYRSHGGHGASFTKTSDGGFLRARVVGFSGDDRWVETTAPYGSVVVEKND